MQINITGRHVEITDPLRSKIEKQLEKLSSNFDDIIEVRVVLSVEKYRQFAEITVSGRNNIRFHSHEATDDMYASIDKAVDKVERQLRRHLSKVRKEKRRKKAEPRSTPEGGDEEASEPEEEFEQHGPYRVSISSDIPQKPMSLEEAVMQLEVSDDVFFTFVNQQTDEVNVIYKKPDGDYGLLRRSF